MIFKQNALLTVFLGLHNEKEIDASHKAEHHCLLTPCSCSANCQLRSASDQFSQWRLQLILWADLTFHLDTFTSCLPIVFCGWPVCPSDNYLVSYTALTDASHLSLSCLHWPGPVTSGNIQGAVTFLSTHALPCTSSEYCRSVQPKFSLSQPTPATYCVPSQGWALTVMQAGLTCF